MKHQVLMATSLALALGVTPLVQAGPGGFHGGGFRGGGFHGGFHGGGCCRGFFWGALGASALLYSASYPWYYPYGYYADGYYPYGYAYVDPGSSVASTPPAAASTAPVWYYCPAAKGYYPYVPSCPSGWQTVPAAPPPDKH